MAKKEISFDTLDSTSEMYLGNKPKAERRCKECGATSGLTVRYHGASGTPVFECATCKSEREAEQSAAEAAHRRQMDEVIWRNNWEE
jgi:hypothetical protein